MGACGFGVAERGKKNGFSAYKPRSQRGSTSLKAGRSGFSHGKKSVNVTCAMCCR